jgi:hypothetical protein
MRIPQSERTKTTNSLLISLMNQLEKVIYVVLLNIFLIGDFDFGESVKFSFTVWLLRKASK